MRSCEHVACWLAMSSCHARTCDYQEKTCSHSQTASASRPELSPLRRLKAHRSIRPHNAAARLRLCRENDLCDLQGIDETTRTDQEWMIDRTRCTVPYSTVPPWPILSRGRVVSATPATVCCARSPSRGSRQQAAAAALIQLLPPAAAALIHIIVHIYAGPGFAAAAARCAGGD